MVIISGDIFSSDVPVIVHQCNCFHTMGSGFAKALRRRFPAVYDADLATEFASRQKLGTCSVAYIDSSPTLQLVFNVYSQFGYGNGCDTDYEAMEAGIEDAFYFIRAHYDCPVRVGIPYLIGCGLAGGDEKRVLSILEDNEAKFDGVSIELYRL